jgi:hypothetical protein
MKCLYSLTEAVDFLLDAFPSPYLNYEIAALYPQLFLQQTRRTLNLFIIRRCGEE